MKLFIKHHSADLCMLGSTAISEKSAWLQHMGILLLAPVCLPAPLPRLHKGQETSLFNLNSFHRLKKVQQQGLRGQSTLRTDCSIQHPSIHKLSYLPFTDDTEKTYRNLSTKSSFRWMTTYIFSICILLCLHKGWMRVFRKRALKTILLISSYKIRSRPGKLHAELINHSKKPKILTRKVEVNS